MANSDNFFLEVWGGHFGVEFDSRVHVRTLRDKSSTTYSILVAMLQIVFLGANRLGFLVPSFC